MTGLEESSPTQSSTMARPFSPTFLAPKTVEGRAGASNLLQAEPVIGDGPKHISTLVKDTCSSTAKEEENLIRKIQIMTSEKNLKVTAVSALLKCGTPQKLVESQCLQAKLMEMLFAEG
ncbi:thioredoxin domain-containing protein 17-like [Mustela lutreola]|uniref:thioredoxin domain-containing protein 17-like n=1 Tax=Mustela lutreola TaxID=9666 RepID=UPI0027973C65|nr:thioredoxin domain-containing protein 17-like [Mustela lutreola]